MTARLKLLLIILFTAVLSGCAVSTDDTVIAGPAVRTGKMTQQTPSSNLPRNVAILPFENMTESDFAYTAVRRTMFNHFASKNYRMLHWQDVDNRLALADLNAPSQIREVPAAELMNILGVDGLIYGNITHYNKTFAGIYAQVSVGVELEFINDRGETIWQVKDVKRSHAGGVSTTPVGLLMNALVSAKHIYGDINLYRTADELGRDLAGQMPEPPSLSGRSKPRIVNVVHSGVNQYLRYGDTLEVALEGDPGMTAVAAVEGIGLIDLREVEPGQYTGSMTLDRKHNTRDAVVTGRLQDDFGQMTSWISPYGLLNVDNLPPNPVTKLSAESRDGAVQLRWLPPANDDIEVYRIGISASETGSVIEEFEVANTNYLLQDIENFRPTFISVAARDHAGNDGPAATVVGFAAPDPRYGDATPLSGNLPVVIEGVYRLSPENNPYYLRNDTRLSAGSVMLIAPGVQFSVSPTAKLSVLGELQIFGTRDEPVRAVALDERGYNEFLVLQTTEDVRIDGLVARGGGIPIQITAGSPLITNCTLAESRFNAVSISGTARPTISNCTISAAKTSGLLISGQALPQLKGNRFVDNEPFHIQSGSTYRIDATGNTWEPAASETTILGDVEY